VALFDVAGEGGRVRPGCSKPGRGKEAVGDNGPGLTGDQQPNRST